MKKKFVKKSSVYFALALLLCAGSVQAEMETSEPPKNIPVASRVMTDIERAELAQTREESETKQARCEDGECDLEEKSFSTKSFYELHYGAFHRLLSVAVDGTTFQLEDGSMWGVTYAVDMFTILGWSTKDSLVIEQWDYSGVEYKIVNQTRDQFVNAIPTLGPLYDGVHTHWVIAKDSFWGTLQLEDGSVWEPYFSTDTAKWLPNDTVILGAYKGSSYFNAILININLLDYARVKLKYAK